MPHLCIATDEGFCGRNVLHSYMCTVFRSFWDETSYSCALILTESRLSDIAVDLILLQDYQ